ncbi:phosphatidylcholine/phosphatidylserine synthase [Quadrisphaera sp. DSM 44207]|uniref:CDP-alcohol phosphatidyltransferase family protein n=1 Tax=Quadrisphaera sp. DSM 44207 TaxID=1881057 RepID=UPI00088AAD2F|nr:CDP-diacylglycerol O-phosphatidyltransferase [Quadrisphaera sp. DSM 44207]SDQ06181.1 phosphatidylcholine synthase [Quadrisphaera sp. DSM 44207]
MDGSARLRLAAGAVHLYTASGSALALLIVLAAIGGDAVLALWLGLVALVIDGTDGMLARRLRVKERLPWFDGARLDDIVDYLTYAFAPVLLLLTDERLPAGPAGTALAAVPLLASSFQFCRVDAKTDDHLFLGFPSYWNVVAFYAVVLDLGPAAVATVLLVCSALVFVPVGYVYPSRTSTLRRTSLALTALWLLAYAVLLAQVPDPHPAVVAVSLGYLVYYVALSLHLTAARRRAARAAGAAPAGSRGRED